RTPAQGFGVPPLSRLRPSVPVAGDAELCRLLVGQGGHLVLGGSLDLEALGLVDVPVGVTEFFEAGDHALLPLYRHGLHESAMEHLVVAVAETEPFVDGSVGRLGHRVLRVGCWWLATIIPHPLTGGKPPVTIAA